MKTDSKIFADQLWNFIDSKHRFELEKQSSNQMKGLVVDELYELWQALDDFLAQQLCVDGFIACLNIDIS